MRLGAKGLLLLVSGYLVLIAAFAFSVNRWLHSFEDAVVLKAARLLAQEETALLADRSLAALEMPDEKSRAYLNQKVQDLTLLSEIVDSISVMDRNGRVIASDRWPRGRQEVPAASVFPDNWEIRPRPGSPARFLRGGRYVLDVPLVDSGRLAGYVQLELRSQAVAQLFSAARRQLLAAALGGLAGVLLLGALLQSQISRRASAIADSIEATPPGSPGTPPRDEFARALRAATGVRMALDQSRQEASRLHRGFAALGQALKMGVVLLRGDRAPDFANARALELFGVSDLDQVRAGWGALRERLGPALATLGPGGAPAGSVEIEAPGKGAARLRLEPYRLQGGAGDEYLLLLNDPEVLDAVEGDVRLANQLQGLARAYRTLTHELRAPLSAMMIHLDLLRESIVGQAAAPGKQAQEGYVVVLREELQRLNRSLAQVLTDALPPDDSGDRFDLRDAVADVTSLLAPQCHRQGVELQCRLPDDPVLLVGYRDRLKQSLLNVAVNALEAMPGGGRLSFEVGLDTLEASIRVRDTGRGIPSDVLEHIYERDFTTKIAGSGIGLFVARSLVQLHGGTIQVESEEGRGTEVMMRLPVLPRG